eukprot:185619_1
MAPIRYINNINVQPILPLLSFFNKVRYIVQLVCTEHSNHISPLVTNHSILHYIQNQSRQHALQLLLSISFIIIVSLKIVANFTKNKIQMIICFFYLYDMNIAFSQIIYQGPETNSYFRNTFNASILNLSVLDCTNESSLFHKTSSTTPVNYYKINITHSMKSAYEAVLLSTCCPPVFMDKWSSYCNDTSLDTNIYVLYEKKGQINLLETSDDVDSTICNNEEKSYVNLLDYKVGQYIIGIGGYAQEHGKYYLKLECSSVAPTQSPILKYSFPIVKSEFDVHSNVNILECNDILHNETNTHEHLVSYYRFHISDDVYPPIVISTCPDSNIDGSNGNHWLYDTYMYIIYDYGDGVVILKQSDIAPSLCNHKSAEIDVSSLLNGEYYAVVQGYDNQIGNFSISMQCKQSPTKVNRKVVMTSVFGLCGLILGICIIFYCYQWRKYRMTAAQFSPSQFSPINDSDDDDTFRQEPSIQLIPMTEKKSDDTAAGVTIRRIDTDKNFAEQLEENEDIIQLMLAHAIASCEEQQGLDVHQVLAIRYYDEQSRQITGTRPFQKIGVNAEFISISPYDRALFIAIVATLSQIMTVTVVVCKLLYRYFTEEICSMEESRWNDVYSLKMISFLMSLIITFHISIALTNIQHDGLYKIVDRLHSKDIRRIRGIAFGIVYLGQCINYYICLVAVIGSYLLILESNRGEKDDDGEVDYSRSGLDMILNLIALFFMFELNNTMVCSQDYNDCREHLSKMLREYKPDLGINAEYVVGNYSDENDVFVGCCFYCTYKFVALFGLFVKACCYGGGFIAPFFIFFCW